MEIIDAQVHVWSELIADPHTPQEARFDTDELLPLMDEAGVDRAVLVPATWGADWNDSCLRAAARFPDRFAVMGRLRVEDPVSRDELAGWREQQGMLGVRISMRREPWATYLVDGTADWLWQAAERAGVAVMIYVPGRSATVGQIAAAHPDLRLVVDHMGVLPGADPEVQQGQLDEVLAIASLENVAVKVSALPLYSQQGPPFADVHPMVRRIIDAFGPERAFWGSDLTRLECSYHDAVAMMDVALDGYTEDERALVMGRGIARWLRWDVASG